MDTSEKYVKMCSEATEIQNETKLDDGDICQCINKGDYYCHCGKVEVFNLLYSSNDRMFAKFNFIWLPRQDQLQEMIEKEGKVVNKLITLIHRFYCENETDYDSFEQLWLAFVMKEKYNKQWNKEKLQWL